MKAPTTNGPKGPQSLAGLSVELAPLSLHEISEEGSRPSVDAGQILGRKQFAVLFDADPDAGHRIAALRCLPVVSERNPTESIFDLQGFNCHPRFHLSDRFADPCILTERSTPTPQQSGEGKGNSSSRGEG